MFIYDTIRLLRQPDALEHCLEKLNKRDLYLADIHRLFQERQEKGEALSSGDVRFINRIFCEYIKAELTGLFIPEHFENLPEHGIEEAGNIIKQLLPPASEDIAERIKTEFRQREMLARVSYIFSCVRRIAEARLEDSAADAGKDFERYCSVTSPVDSSTVFMQYLNNHISDGNWQKLACSKDRTASRMRQKELLETEYAQCHYTPGDPDYAALEKQYRDLSARIDADLNTDTIGGNTGMTPWILRKILRSYVSIPHREETARWTWQKYCALKSAVNGASSEPQKQNFSTRNPFSAVPEKTLF